MRIGPGQRWMVCGVVGAVALLAVGWFVLIGPERSRAASLREQTVAAGDGLVPLQRQLADLRDRSAKLPQYKAELVRSRLALPTAAGVSDFLRSLQTTGDKASVSVTGLVVGQPTEIAGTSPRVYGMLLAVTAAGPVTALVRFLDQLQLVQPRAVLLSTLNLVPVGKDASFDADVTLTLALQAFVAPPAPAATPEPAPTKTN